MPALAPFAEPPEAREGTVTLETTLERTREGEAALSDAATTTVPTGASRARG